ncbi:hypothetical protein BEP19_14150 [Ammoniphilus oxalaticus]|uniref:ABC transporter domain-containing protein n=1 Tax=Ammoniphilus oxalaticus TaxID=66863 RepID=A0A419SF53_9BACL|nr:ABC transporter ATP-binding protein [Ammoniphilus oxalaticus]RKD21760.1 hypothetical protein BEP19_14150 [Ammoniphilus oxalaticus]
MATLLKFDNISFTYDSERERTTILSQHDCEIKENEFVSLVGLSGCGKSTVVKLMAGLYQPTSGEIEFNGGANERLGHVSLMPQQDMLMPWRTITENAALPLEIQGVRIKEAEQQVHEYLPSFGLEGVAQAFPDQLSGGMRQRVSFLRAMLGGHHLLLLDEPFSALDAFTRREMQLWLTDTWQEWGRSIFLITHDIEEAIFLSDRIFIMEKGQTGPFQEIVVPFERPRPNNLHLTKEFIELRSKITELLFKKETNEK